MNKAKKIAVEKNPLSVALGYYLSRERQQLPKDIGNKSKDVAAAIKIGDSLYRMIESGNARIHPKTVLKYISVFNSSGIKFEALCKFLVTIHFLDAYLEDYTEFKKAINELKDVDEQFKTLFEAMRPVFESIEKGNQNIKPLIEEEKIYDEIRKLLTESDSYGKSSEEIQEEQIVKIYNRVPTFYSDFAHEILNKIFSLPLTIRFSKLWQWEDEYSSRFRLMYSIVKNHENVTSYSNLFRYNYKFLWEKDFEKFHFIFLDCDKDGVKEKFKTNLKEVYKNKGFAKHDTRFLNYEPGDKKFNEIIDNKVEFNAITTKNFNLLFQKIKTEMNEDFQYPLIARVDETGDDGSLVTTHQECDAAWVYELKDRN
jgi:uncharacterized protein YdcH (DUF465 family)